MNKHPQQEILSAYIDDMLDVAQMHHTAQHLQACTPCRAACASLRETRDLLRHLSAPPAAHPEFWTNAYRQVRVNGAKRQAPDSLLEQMRHGLLGTQRRWAAGVAAATLLAAILAGPIVVSEHRGLSPAAVPAATAAPDVIDLSTLVRDHTQSAAAQPLADSDRQTMLSADVDDGASSGETGAEAAGNGILFGDATP